ncbi:MAG: MFS transporter [Actinobacteria bacterium]|nr:MAG: MFS transporter [Actinomycetota bacterium]
MPDTSLRRARFSVAAVFLIHAAVFGTWATRIPAIKHHIGINDGQLGIALAGLAVGLFIGTRLAGVTVERFGSRPAIRTAILVLCAALIGPALAGNLLALTVALAVLGVLGGFVDVAMNAQAVIVERGYGRPIMNSLHGLWSVGLLAGSVIGAGAAALNVSTKLHFGLVGAGLVAPAVLALGGLLAAGAEALPAELGRHEPSERPLLLQPVVLLLGLIAFSSFSAEGAAADWSAVYLRDSLHTGAGFAASAFVAFSCAMAACRLLSDRLTARFGPVLVVRTGSLVAGFGLGLGLMVHRPSAGVAAFALMGVGLAPVVPLTFSAAGNTGLGPTGVILGRVVTMGYLGSIVGPIVIGALAQAVGLRSALLLLVALTLVIAGTARFTSFAAGGTRLSTPAWPGAEPYDDAKGAAP